MNKTETPNPPPIAWENVAFNLSSEFGPEDMQRLEAFAKAFWREMLSQCARHPSPESEASGWVSIDDRLPNEPNSVLIYLRRKAIEIGYFNGRWSTHTDGERTDVTHWMPFPAAPASPKEAI